MLKILITGANSYIGTSFEKYMSKWPDKYAVDTVDMLDGSWREKSFAGYDSVYHVAGIAHADTGRISEEQKALYYKVNTDLAIETAKKAKAEGVPQFIYMSSIIVYGDSAPIGKKKVITKDTPVNPANCYGDSKVQAEIGLRELEDDSFKVVILRPPMIYGKGSKGNYPILAKLARKLPVFPNIENQRSMLYIENLAEFVRLMIKNGEHGTFFPQNSEYTETSEMVRLIAAANGRKIRLLNGFTWTVKLCGIFTGLVNKAFGNLAYEQKMSLYKEEYRIIGLEESISKTEGGEKKKVLMICSSSQNIYTFRLPLINKFKSEGYEVYTVAFDGDYATELNEEGVNFACINDSNRSLNPLKILSLRKKYQSVIESIKPDVVFTFMLKPNTFGVIAAKKAGVKRIFSMVEGAGDPFAKKGIKWELIKRVECCLYRHSLKYVRKVFFLNDDDKNEFVKLNLVDEEKAERLYGIGVDLVKFSYNEVDLNSNIFLMMARMLKSKGVLEYCQCAEIVKNQYPEAEFIYLGGEGDIKVKDIQEYIDKGIVKYVGNVRDVREYVKRALMIILPSFYREGMPMSIMEAEACGRGVITTNNTGCRDTVRNGYNGYLVDKGDVENIAELCCRVLNNKELAKEMGYNARLFAEERFDQRRINETILKHIRKN